MQFLKIILNIVSSVTNNVIQVIHVIKYKNNNKHVGHYYSGPTELQGKTGKTFVKVQIMTVSTVQHFKVDVIKKLTVNYIRISCRKLIGWN